MLYKRNNGRSGLAVKGSASQPWDCGFDSFWNTTMFHINKHAKKTESKVIQIDSYHFFRIYFNK